MRRWERPLTILMADDDAEDRLLLRDALAEAGVIHRLEMAVDGEQLFDYLERRGAFAQADSPLPSLILLDLNMPRKDGREALEALKADPRWRTIPVVVLTTSTLQDDIEYSYRSGACSYITKPVSFARWVELAKVLGRYWFEVVELPVRD